MSHVAELHISSTETSSKGKGPPGLLGGEECVCPSLAEAATWLHLCARGTASHRKRAHPG